MDYTAFVGVCQRVGDSGAVSEDLTPGQGPASRHDRVQRLAGHVFHDDERPASVLADLVDGADAGMGENGRVPGFSEQRRVRPLARRPPADDLDRHPAPEARVTGEVNLSHAAAAEQRFDHVTAERAARLQLRIGGRGDAGGPRRDLVDRRLLEKAAVAVVSLEQRPHVE